MALGLDSKLDVLQASPYDQNDFSCESPVKVKESGRQQWIPSRYNIRATAEDGRLVLWNTMSGALIVIPKNRVPLTVKALRRSGFEAERQGQVKYLADRGFLVPAGTNEYRTFQHRFAAQQHRTDMLQLMLMPTEDCNFRCRYCYEDFVRGTMPWEIREGIKKFVHKKASSLKHLAISWFGGEPLYGWDAIEDLAPFFVEITEEHGVSLGGHMTTNGYLLTPERQARLLNWKVNGFQITLDGSPEDHDRNRPGRDGSSTFWQIFENLESLSEREEDFRVKLRINVDLVNYPRIPEFLDMVQERLGGDPRFVVNFHPVSKWGGGNDERLEVCGTDSDTIMQELTKAAEVRELSLEKVELDGKFGQQVCYAARPYQYLIGSAGQVMKCTILLDKDPANVVGQIRPDGTMELDQSKVAAWTEPIYERDTGCAKCVLLPNCGGAHCPLPHVQGGDGKVCVPERSAPKTRLLEVLAGQDESESSAQDSV